MKDMRESFEQQLRALGLRTPLDDVIEVVRRLGANASLYSLYSHPKGKGRPATIGLVSKVTAQKIRDLWKKGHLQFLTEVPPEKREIDISGEKARSASPAYQMPVGWQATATHYAAIMEEMPSVEWSIRGLEASGFTSEEALPLLFEFDSLYPNYVRAAVMVQAAQPAPGPIPDDSLKSFVGHYYPMNPHLPPLPPGSLFQPFVAIHYLVEFKREYPKGPLRTLRQAAEMYAEGLVTQRPLLIGLGRAILRYEIWRDQEHLAVFRKAQEPLGRRALRRLDKEIGSPKSLEDYWQEDIKRLEQAQEVQQQEDTNARQPTATE